MGQFKKITQNDLAVLHDHYLKFEPYSDFNVLSIWGYMVPGAKYLKVGDSVLYEMIDYNTGHPYLTILGNKNTGDLLRQLLRYTRSTLITLHSVPESTCKIIKKMSAAESVQEDPSNHDYIFSVESISNLTGEELRHKKKALSKLKRQHPYLEARIIDHNSQKARGTMYAVFRNWIKQSGSKDWGREYRAVQRALKLRGFNVICLGAYDKNKLVGFTVNEIEKNGYYQGHYGKANYNYRGLGLFLEHETAKYILEHFGTKYMNLQQDLGIEGIRYYKSSLKPLKQLKKYTVVINMKKLIPQ